MHPTVRPAKCLGAWESKEWWESTVADLGTPWLLFGFNPFPCFDLFSHGNIGIASAKAQFEKAHGNSTDKADECLHVTPCTVCTDLSDFVGAFCALGSSAARSWVIRPPGASKAPWVGGSATAPCTATATQDSGMRVFPCCLCF